MPTEVFDLNPHRACKSDWSIHEGSKKLARPVHDEHEPRLKISRAGARTWDQKLGAWVMAPMRDQSRDGLHAPARGAVHLPDKSGKFWWISCRVTGHRMQRIEALDRWAAIREADRLFPGGGWGLESCGAIEDGLGRGS